ncbi:hypothetical protein AXFE_08870 [Acidithrix ferrooxidans]|uniref:Uncharacterized protein n=1 Tax=Acidithrix ferrooxidans TaxID=1280514 RepID=A0A0D8HKD9_9ACTN|nr:hypothetical protein AXFE_08870 [Acidithrix ferrooxidans]
MGYVGIRGRLMRRSQFEYQKCDLFSKGDMGVLEKRGLVLGDVSTIAKQFISIFIGPSVAGDFS